MEPTTLGERIATRRKEMGMTQADLAKAARVSAPAVSYWETGDTKNLKNEHLFAIADALRVEPRWLALGTFPKVRRVAAWVMPTLLAILMGAPQQSDAADTLHNSYHRTNADNFAHQTNVLHIVRRWLRQCFARFAKFNGTLENRINNAPNWGGTIMRWIRRGAKPA